MKLQENSSGQEEQQPQYEIKQITKKRQQQLSTILENGESYMISPHPKNYVDIESTPKNSEIPPQQDQQSNQQIQTLKKRAKHMASKFVYAVETSNQLVNDNLQTIQKPSKKKDFIEHQDQVQQNGSKKRNRQISSKKKESNSRMQNNNDNKEIKPKSKRPSSSKLEKKNYDFKEDEMIKNIKISLTNIPEDILVNNDNAINSQTKIRGVIKEYEINWNAFTFFLDKRIRWQDKLLFLISVCLILSDVGASIYEFYVFASTSCFGYQSEMEFSDIINIITSVILKLCCVNIIMQEITNTLPGNMSIPFLIPLSIMGITPNLQLNQYVYSFSSCSVLNPVIPYKSARTITRLLCYFNISIIGLLCVFIMIIRIQISRQTWKRLKNIGFYVLIGGFLLSLIFIFIFVSITQINKETILSLCLDNVTFWIFVLVCVFFTVRKLIYKINPFPFDPAILQQVNTQSQLYAKEDDIESHRLTLDPQKEEVVKPNHIEKKQITSILSKHKSSTFKKDQQQKQQQQQQNIQQQQPQQQEQENVKPKKQKKKIVFSEEFDQDKEERIYSFTKYQQKEILKSQESANDSPDRMIKLEDKQDVHKNIEDQHSQPESNIDAATSSSTSHTGSKKFKFNSKKRTPDPTVLKIGQDDDDDGSQVGMGDSQPQSKTSLSKKTRSLHDNLSNSSKSSINKEDAQFISQNFSYKSFGLLNQDLSGNIKNESLSEFQKRDQELQQLNKPQNQSTLSHIANNNQSTFNHLIHQNNLQMKDSQKENIDDQNNRQRIRSLNKFEEDDELSENQQRKYSLPHSDNNDNTHHKLPHENNKKSLFEKSQQNNKSNQMVV